MATYEPTSTDPTRRQTTFGSETDSTTDKGKTDHAKETIARKGHEYKEAAAEKARPRFEQAKEQGRRNLESTASALRDTAEHLREEDQAAMAGYTEWAAGQVDSFAGYFRDRKVDDVMRDVRSMARRNPAMVLGGALMAGFMAARFLKASEPTAYGHKGYSDRNRSFDFPAARPPARPYDTDYTRPYGDVR
ncbi:MAG: hypothetical protein ACOC3W_00750 [Thermodesulfobacteriota bacterium]